MPPIPSTVVGALVAEDLLLLAQVFSDGTSEGQELLETAIQMKLGISLSAATPELITQRASDLKKFQHTYQEFIIGALQRQQQQASDEALRIQTEHARWLALVQFRQRMSIVLLTVSLSYILALTWLPVPPDNQRFADTSLGFLLATVIATIINFFFGTNEFTKSELRPPDTKKCDQSKSDRTRL